MINLKETAIQAIKELPDDTTIEDIINAIYIRTKAIAGMKEIEKENYVSSSTLREEVEEWK